MCHYESRKRRDAMPVSGTGPQMLFWAARNASKALKIASNVSGLLNTEFKLIDTTASTNILATWSVVPITECAQGADATNREGRSILAKSVYFTAGISAAAAQVIPVRVRVAIFVDDMQQGVAPVGTDVWTVNGMEALRNVIVKQKRFKILYDKCHTINDPNGGNAAISIRKYLPMSRHVKYIGTTAAAASDGYGSMYFAFITDGTSPNIPVINYAVRVRFIDN